MLVAKVALGFCGTMILAGAYTFHEGILQVEEAHGDGRHVHVWIPAALIPMAMHVVPRHYLTHAAEQADPALPTIRVLAKELERYPDAELVDIREPDQQVRVSTRSGKLLIDVEGRDETVHVRCPLATLEHVSRELQANAPPL